MSVPDLGEGIHSHTIVNSKAVVQLTALETRLSAKYLVQRFCHGETKVSHPQSDETGNLPSALNSVGV